MLYCSIMNFEKTDSTRGLTTEEIIKRPKNITVHHRSDVELALSVAKAQVVSFFFLLLIVSGGLSFYLDAKIDATIFFGIALINAVIGFFKNLEQVKVHNLLKN